MCVCVIFIPFWAYSHKHTTTWGKREKEMKGNQSGWPFIWSGERATLSLMHVTIFAQCIINKLMTWAERKGACQPNYIWWNNKMTCIVFVVIFVEVFSHTHLYKTTKININWKEWKFLFKQTSKRYNLKYKIINWCEKSCNADSCHRIWMQIVTQYDYG